KAIKDLNGTDGIKPTDRFFFYAAGHGQRAKEAPEKKAAADTPFQTGFSVPPRTLQAVTPTDSHVPALVVRHHHVARPTVAVRLNGTFLGYLDPGQEQMSFEVPEEFIGTCAVGEILDDSQGLLYEYEAAMTFSPGGLNGLLVEGAEEPPADACAEGALLTPFFETRNTATAHTVTYS